ncbi:hypothetical protein [Dechloromonas hortensis]|uniref:hypothetical protein n=1 Tax=Dechloromonas hortensis TaxID=337779 RepID=UPI00129281A8|nr:hypothetical protein [Dechloromonas hortensis]
MSKRQLTMVEILLDQSQNPASLAALEVIVVVLALSQNERPDNDNDGYGKGKHGCMGNPTLYRGGFMFVAKLSV